MDSFLSWLRFGFFGRPAMQLVNGDESVLRFVVLLAFLAVLIIFIIVASVKFRYAILMAVAFVLCFGYLMGAGMAIVGLLIGFWIFRSKHAPTSAPLPESDDVGKQPIDDWDRYMMQNLDRKARTCLESEYGQFQIHMQQVRTKTDLEYFERRWEPIINARSDKWD